MFGQAHCWRQVLLVFTVTAIVFGSVQSARPTTLIERDQAKALAVIVNDVLSAYIAVHNDVFKVSANRLVPIPGFFEAIDFKKHVTKLQSLRDKLGMVDQQVATWIANGVGDAKVRTFLMDLRAYSMALSEAVRRLEHVSRQLYNKTNDPTHYSWESYNKDLDKYQAAIEGYLRLAPSLNESYQRLQE